MCGFVTVWSATTGLQPKPHLSYRRHETATVFACREVSTEKRSALYLTLDRTDTTISLTDACHYKLGLIEYKDACPASANT